MDKIREIFDFSFILKEQRSGAYEFFELTEWRETERDFHYMCTVNFMSEEDFMEELEDILGDEEEREDSDGLRIVLRDKKTFNYLVYEYRENQLHRDNRIPPFVKIDMKKNPYGNHPCYVFHELHQWGKEPKAYVLVDNELVKINDYSFSDVSKDKFISYKGVPVL